MKELIIERIKAHVTKYEHCRDQSLVSPAYDSVYYKAYTSWVKGHMNTPEYLKLMFEGLTDAELLSVYDVMLYSIVLRRLS